MIVGLAIAGIVAGLSAALWPTRAPADPEAGKTPTPTKPPETPPDKKVTPTGINPGAAAAAGLSLLGPGTAGALGGGAATLAVGAAAVAATIGAGAAIGAGITGDVGGAIGGGVGTALQMVQVGGGFTFITGQAGNVGRVLGREIDRVLNGTGLPGVSGSRVAIEAAGFAAGLATVSTAVTMIPFIGQTFALVVLIASAVQDANRVAYGQQGLVTDAFAEASSFFNASLEVTTRRVCEVLNIDTSGGLDKALSAPDMVRIRAVCIAQAVGFSEEMNAQRERAWMIRPRGIGQNDAFHRTWGEARGLYLRIENLDEVRRRLRRLMASGDPRDELTQAEWDEHRARGAKSANWKNYLAAMAEPFDAFATADAHAVKWSRAGAFTGATNTDGDLVDGVVRIDFRRSLIERRVVTITNEAAINTGPLPAPPPGAPPAPGFGGGAVGGFGTGTRGGAFGSLVPKVPPPPAPAVIPQLQVVGVVSPTANTNQAAKRAAAAKGGLFQ